MLILPGDMIDTRDHVVWDHPLNQGRLVWFLSTPDQFNGTRWYDLTGQYNFTQLDFGGGNFGTWKTSTVRDGWDNGGFYCHLGGLRLTGSNVSGHPLKLTDNFSVILWVNNTNAGGGNSKILGGWGGASDGNWYIQSGASSGTNAFRRFTFGGNSAIISDAIFYNDNQWYMMALVASGGTTNLYFSSEEPSGSSGARITPQLVGSGSTTYSGTGTNYIQAGDDNASSLCAVDDISVWNRPLTIADIAYYYQESRTRYPKTLRRSSWILTVPPEISLVASSSIGFSSAATPVDGFPHLTSSSNLGLSSVAVRPVYDRALASSSNVTLSSVAVRPKYDRALAGSNTVALSGISNETIFEFRNVVASSHLTFAGLSVSVPFERLLGASSRYYLSGVLPLPGHDLELAASNRITLSCRAVFPQSRPVSAYNFYYLWPIARWYKSPIPLTASSTYGLNNSSPDLVGRPTTPVQVTIGQKPLFATSRLTFAGISRGLGIGNKPVTSSSRFSFSGSSTVSATGFKLVSASSRLFLSSLGSLTHPGPRSVTASSSFRMSGIVSRSIVRQLAVVASSAIRFSALSRCVATGDKLLVASAALRLSGGTSVYMSRAYALVASSRYRVSGSSRNVFDRALRASSTYRISPGLVRSNRDLHLSASSNMGLAGVGDDNTMKLVASGSLSLHAVASLSYQVAGLHASNSFGLSGAAWCSHVLPWRRAPLSTLPGGNLPHS